MSEAVSSMPVNNIGSGAIEKVDPIMTAKPLKRLRDIIGTSKKELSKEKGQGV